jgi:hypothetical protein
MALPLYQILKYTKQFKGISGGDTETDRLVI